MKKIIISINLILFFAMAYTTLWASLQINLFDELQSYIDMPWFRATLVDFYINQLVIWFFVLWNEKKRIVAVAWLPVFICFGSMGTTLYAIIFCIKNKNLFKGETL